VPTKTLSEFSRQLKDIAKDLSFLATPRYPLVELTKLFPEHKGFLSELSDVSTPFNIDLDEKRKLIDHYLKRLEHSDIPEYLKKIFTGRAQDYYLITQMMESFGKPSFYDLCTKLYGSSNNSQKSTSLSSFVEQINKICPEDLSHNFYAGEDALLYLKNKLSDTFDQKHFEVKASTSLLSDASAGRKTFKLNLQKKYSENQLNIFLAHEGWAHLGTSINGSLQEDHPWLGTWTPRITSLQEGLAVLCEIISGHMTKARWNKIILRHLATSMAEKGSSIKDVHSFLRHNQLEDLDAFKVTLRIFRGVPIEGGMSFTKELLYLHGLIKILKHLDLYKPELKSFWIGKISFEEHSLLHLNTDLLQKNVFYFPKELESTEAKQKLESLRFIVNETFKNDFE